MRALGIVRKLCQLSKKLDKLLKRYCFFNICKFYVGCIFENATKFNFFFLTGTKMANRYCC